MRRLAHWIYQWRALPRDERAIRTRAVADRLARRHPRVRALGLVAETPSWSRLQRELTVPLDQLIRSLRADEARRGPLFSALDERVRGIVDRRPRHVRGILDRARGVLDNRFELLGHPVAVRPDRGLDWHRDPRSGRDWPRDTYYLDVVTVRGDGSDVKYPWELSRGQHLLVLAQAWWFSGSTIEQRSASELGARCAERIAADLRDWIRCNPRGLGVNWTCTMDVGIRAYVWIAALALLRGAPELDDGLYRVCVRSLWLHGRHIRANLERGEHGLTSNHYLSNLVGLFAIACALPELRESEEWLRFAHRAIEQEIERQVHGDGVDFERSVPYHRLVTELFVHAALLARQAGRRFSAGFDRRLARMLEFVAGYTRPDGSAPQWGDNDDGRLLPLEGWAAAMPHDHRHLMGIGGAYLDRRDLVSYTGERDIEARWLVGDEAVPSDAAAEYRSRSFENGSAYVLCAPQIHVFVGCAPVGTCGIGNHTHNDLFSPTIWAEGTEWVTDPGSGSYTGQPELRNRLRGTAAHATLQLGTREQNGLAAGMGALFRVEQRAAPEVVEWESRDDRTVLTARHRGFSGDGQDWIHERRFVLLHASRVLHIADRLERVSGPSTPEEHVSLRFPLGPSVEIVDIGRKASDGDERAMDEAAALASRTAGDAERHWVTLRDPRGVEVRIGLLLPRRAVVESVEAEYSPGYGVVETAQSLVARFGPAGSCTDSFVLFRYSPK